MFFLNYQYVPHILIGTFKRTEADAHTQKSLATPSCAGYNRHLSHRLRLAAVDGHAYFLINVSLQELLQGVIILILPRMRITYNLSASF